MAERPSVSKPDLDATQVAAALEPAVWNLVGHRAGGRSGAAAVFPPVKYRIFPPAEFEPEPSAAELEPSVVEL